MEESDDSCSFAIALDSDQETDSFHDADSAFTDLSEGAVCPRASSPTWSVASLSSLRRRTVPKRPAPNPPNWNPPPNCRITPEEGAFTNTSRDSSEVMPDEQHNPGTHVEGTQSKYTVPSTEAGGMNKFATRPIHLVSAHTTPGKLTRQMDLEGHVSPCLSGQVFSESRLHWIDDVVEPVSHSPPISASAGTSIYSGMSFLRGCPNPYSMSAICPDLRAGSGAAVPFYLGSVNPGTVSPLGLPPENSHPYEWVNQPSYAPQIPPMVESASLVSTPVSSSPSHPKGMKVIKNSLPLSHSASDPGIHRMLRGEPLLSPLGPGPSLDRLSEAEENNDADHSSDEVFNTQSYSSTTRDLILASEGRGRRSDRHDSIGSPLACEDLLVSAWVPFKVTFTNLTMVVISVALLMPNSAAILYSLFRLVFGTLFPAYYSYKAVRTKNVKEYVKWMMYWIVFAFFTCVETITDVFLSFWFPFYYEIKILVVLWLLSPATRGSSILYRKFVHPWLTRREEEIDECIAKAKQQGYSTVVQLGTKGVNYATNVIMQTAIKGGGGLVSQLKRSYSASEIGEDTADHNRNMKALTTKEPLHNPSEEEDVISVSSGQNIPLTRARLRASRTSNVEDEA